MRDLPSALQSRTILIIMSGSPTTPQSSVFTVGSSQPTDSDTDAAYLDPTSERAGMNWVQEKVGVCVEEGRKEGSTRSRVVLPLFGIPFNYQFRK